MPSLVGDPEGPKTIDQWFNASAFKPVGTFGNATPGSTAPDESTAMP